MWIHLCRMVKDDPDEAVEQSQNYETDTQSNSPHSAGPAASDQSQESEKADRQEPTEAQLDILFWKKFNLKADPGSWDQLVNRGDGDTLPTHLRPFSSHAEYELVKTTYQQLQHSGYYWGPMTMEEAHAILKDSLMGTFLIRDSGQPDVFFTLSYQSEDGPTSVRVQLNNLLFSLNGSQRNFPSLFSLLTFYTSSSCKLTVPYRRRRPESLKQTCRRAFIRTHGAENISTSPGLSFQVKNYLCAYPHSI